MTAVLVSGVARRLKRGGHASLATLRRRYGITTITLAQRSGLLMAAIADFKSGRKKLPAASVARLREALRLCIVDHCLETAFLLGEGDPRLNRLRATRVRPPVPGAAGGLVLIDDEHGEIIYGPARTPD